MGEKGSWKTQFHLGDIAFLPGEAKVINASESNLFNLPKKILALVLIDPFGNFQSRTTKDLSKDSLLNSPYEDSPVAHALKMAEYKRLRVSKKIIKKVVFQPGVKFGIRYDGNIIISILSNSPAFNAGVDVGWKIKKINDIDISNTGQ